MFRPKIFSNWDRMRDQDIRHTVKYRDVYEDQQLERSESGQKQSMTSRLILDAALTVVVFFLSYFSVGIVSGLAAVLYGYDSYQHPFSYYVSQFSFSRLLICFIISASFYGVMYLVLKHNLDVQNSLDDTADINQYQNDQHIALPAEIQRKFDWFPDVGATSSVQVSSMISHCALNNKGIHPVRIARRAIKDVQDEDGDVVIYKGEVLCDDQGNTLFEEVPMMDVEFAHALFEASDLPKSTGLRKFYNASLIPYNPENKDRDKQKGYDTVADLINHDWVLPEYEPQRPGGAYLVDTAPVNTMVLAITRAGKGQTVIEPTIDMWTREKSPNNIVVNDPKGELLVKFYVRATVRGYQVIQFNLINAMKTDIYNPLGLAAEAAREGDFTKAALYVENIADVFFPVDGSEDPVWPNAANNAFKRAAYGLIDYYLEEEREYRLWAEENHVEEKVIETHVDEMWGKVTLYNTYQLFVQLTAKKKTNPLTLFEADVKSGKYGNLSDEEYLEQRKSFKDASKPWEGKPSADCLTLYFNATDMLPMNSMRRLISNANNALRSMSGAEKMLASVYGIAITAMSFFTDPTISTLTSGTPSQNVDLSGMSFPRMFGIRFHADFVTKYHLIGMQAKWMSFSDDAFTQEMGKDFYHEDIVSREGWAKYYFKGKYPGEKAYVRLQLVNAQTGMLVRSFYFEFTKSYQTSLDARYYMTDPILGSKIVKNGILVELKQFKTKKKKTVYRRGKTTFRQVCVRDVLTDNCRLEEIDTNAIIMTQVRYTEKPRILFLVTPPHLMKYAKLILILIKQLVDLNFDRSYMTKSSQKPLLKTRFMLDELGNLQSDGHGISGFATMLSIGLGQDQQFSATCCTMKSCTT